jgi:hypothetical protein
MFEGIFCLWLNDCFLVFNVKLSYHKLANPIVAASSEIAVHKCMHLYVWIKEL